MIYYIEVATGRYPVRAEDLCELYDVQPEDLTTEYVLSKGFSPVLPAPLPPCSFHQMPMEAKPTPNGDGTHSQVWIIVNRFANDAERVAEIAVLKGRIKEMVTERRWVSETSGITLPNGVKIKTDRESQSQLNSAYNCLKNGLLAVTPWKAEGDVWVDVSVTEIEPIARAVATHVNVCFAIERQHHQAIDALYDPAQLLAYNVNANWPFN